METTNLIITPKSEDPRITWCKENLLKEDYDPEGFTCEIDDNNRLIIHGDIIIPDVFEELPIKIDEVYGSVTLLNSKNHASGSFKSLKNFPEIIHGKLEISINKGITAFNGEIKRVEGSLWALNCGLSSLENMPEYIGGSLLISCNNIKYTPLPEKYVVKNDIIW